MLDTSYRLEGIRAITKAMAEVGHEVSYKGGRSALRKAADLIAGAVKKNAQRLDDPETAEKIAENVAVRWSPKKFKRSGDLMFRVGILGGARQTNSRPRRIGNNTLEELGELSGKGKGNPGGDTFYWRFLEFGTQRLRAQPFMRPALERNAQVAIIEFVTQLKKAIARTAKKGTK